MPDLVTHSFAAWLFTRPGHWQKAPLLFFLGAILPDLVSRPIYILFPMKQEYTVGMHTPLFTILTGLLAAEGMAPELRRIARLSISGGIVLHFGLDIMQRHLVGGYYWFFPFSWRSFELGWFWPETTVPWIPVWLGAMLAGEIFLFLRRKRRFPRA